MLSHSKNSKPTNSVGRGTWHSLSWALFVPVVFAAFVSSCYAEQRVVGADQRQIEIAISAKEGNALSIAGGVVRNVSVVKGLLDYKRDALGVLNFVVKSDEAQTISLTVTDEEGVRYHTMLIPKPIPSQEIVLVSSGAAGAQAPRGGAMGASVAGGSTTSYQRRLKLFTSNVIESVASTATPVAGMSKTVVNELVPLWKEVTLRYVQRLVDGDFVAEHYELTNVSSELMQIAEPELMRPGVIGIHLAKQSLNPGEFTHLVVLRARGQHE
jgi:conjugal transfer pilus assembly protein TraK